MHAARPLQRHNCSYTSPMLPVHAAVRMRPVRYNSIQTDKRSPALASCRCKCTLKCRDRRSTQRIRYTCVWPLAYQQPRAKQTESTHTHTQHPIQTLAKRPPRPLPTTRELAPECLDAPLQLHNTRACTKLLWPSAPLSDALQFQIPALFGQASCPKHH